MNYRHAFHAGNFADVLKHATLVRVLVHLRSKSAPFRVVDTHAGAGLYDLSESEATRGGEWRDGIARLFSKELLEPARALLAPYLEAVAALNRPNDLIAYPGSPMLVRGFLRRGDRLIACELEPRAAVTLAHNLKADARCKAIAIDGWTALKAYIPPKERAASSSSIRHSRMLPILAGLPRGLNPRIANGRTASICCGIRARTVALPRLSRPGCVVRASVRSCASRSACRCRRILSGCGPAGSSSSIRRGRSKASSSFSCRSCSLPWRRALTAAGAWIGLPEKSKPAQAGTGSRTDVWLRGCTGSRKPRMRRALL